jgi:CubicO group peptidase (beta-lactamase class C family)
MQTTLTDHTARGEVAPGFERVRDAFASRLDDLELGGGAFCAFVHGEKVVDLWAGQATSGVPWRQDTMATVMSCTKGLAALCMQILHDRGQLDVDAPVATYWPEFAQAGKGDALVRHVLTHTVGVLGFREPGSLLGWDGTGWDAHDQIAARLAAARPAWRPGSKIGYHAMSFGWLTAELVRRVTGRSIGTFFRDEVAKPLGVDGWIGTPVEEQERVAPVIRWSYDRLPRDVVELDRMTREHMSRPETLLAQAAIHMHGSTVFDNISTFMNDPRVRALEIPAANASATARGLARTYAMLSMNGALDGVRIVSPESVKVFGAHAASGPSSVEPAWRLPGGRRIPPPAMAYALGYERNVAPVGQPGRFGPSAEAFGHTGLGGQVGFCDPTNGIGVGFVRSHLSFSQELSVVLVDALYSCAGVRPC